MTIFASEKTIPIGTVLKSGVLNFKGSVRDWDGKLQGEGRVVLIIKREATREEYFNQFKENNITVSDATKHLAKRKTTKFYEVLTD